ncbi:transposase [Bifidobacteriaceae bacterium MCC01958]|nr:transposase [Bifidobacteriaceae bacterium MCC01958]
MTGSHRNEDRGGERRWTFNGVEYPTRKLMCAARREEYVRLLDEKGMNFTQAAHAVGVSKRTGKVWRNGRTRATGRNERASMDWYRSTMDKPKRIHARYLNQEERILIADRLRPGDSIRAIARLPGRDPGAVSREVERNRNPGIGDCGPCRAQQKAADRLKRPRPRKAAEGTPLWVEILAGLRRHWSPEQIANRPRWRTGRSPATGRATSSPAPATKARSARSSSARPGSRSCSTCPMGTTPNTSSRPSSTKWPRCPNSCAIR